MKKILWLTMMLFGFSLLAAPAALLAEMKTEKDTAKQETSFQNRSERITALMGRSVRSMKEEDLGQVVDLVIAPDGDVSYLVVSHGGLLGIGNDLIPVPWEAVRKKTDDHLVVNIDKAKLQKAPNFGDKKWPDFDEPEWDITVRGYYDLDNSDLYDLEKGDLDNVDLDRENPGTEEPGDDL